VDPVHTQSRDSFRPVARGAKRLKVSSVMLIAVLASALATDAAWARGKGGSRGGARSAHHAGTHHHHHHARSGVFVGAFAGAPLWPGWGYAPEVYAAAPVYYIEQSEQSEGEWLYCSAANAYFPYVAECAGGWQRVPARPPPSQP
jgi:hypothetical protein